MKVQINIECFDAEEFFRHLTVIRQRVRKELPKAADNILEFEEVEENGSHDCLITL